MDFSSTSWLAGQRNATHAASESLVTSHVCGNRSFAVRTDGTFWIWGFGSIGGQGILGKNLHVPTLLELP